LTGFEPDRGPVEQARELLARARNVMVITGAGISAESGIPVFRTGDGRWDKANPLDYATPEAFRDDPDRVWHWYDDRRQKMARARPNPGHLALARLESSGRRVFIVTQNVDDLHEQAGSREVVHIHGSIWRVRCERDGAVEENREVPLEHGPPLCHCGNPMRPDVVWFGESLPWRAVQSVHEYLLAGGVDACLVVGTEASFGYIVEWVFEAREAGAVALDVNPRRTGLGSLVDLHLAGPAGTVLPAIVP